jgi:hypothetical protein
MTDAQPTKEPITKVRLDRSTWIALGSFVVLCMATLAGLALFSFETKTAATEHKGEFKTHKAEADSNFAFHDKDVDGIEKDVEVLQKTMGNVRDNVIILMERRGLRGRVKALPADVAEALEPEPTEDP